MTVPDNADIDLELALACRGYAYEMFHMLFAGNPSKELAELVSSSQTAAALNLAGRAFLPGNPASDGKIASLSAMLSRINPEDELQISNLRCEYMRHIAGPLKQNAQPWESFYTSHRHLLFQETTLEVREFYRRWGCLPKEYPRVADDHVSLECAFMGVLCRRSQESLASGDGDGLRATLSGQRDFLEKHMLKWIPLFAEAIAPYKDSSIYPSAVIALSELCEIDGEWLSRAIPLAAKMKIGPAA